MAVPSPMERATAPAVYISPEGHITRAMAATHIGTIVIQEMAPSPIPAAQVTAEGTTGIQLKAVLLATGGLPVISIDFPKSLARFASLSHVVSATPGTSLLRNLFPTASKIG